MFWQKKSTNKLLVSPLLCLKKWQNNLRTPTLLLMLYPKKLTTWHLTNKYPVIPKAEDPKSLIINTVKNVQEELGEHIIIIREIRVNLELNTHVQVGKKMKDMLPIQNAPITYCHPWKIQWTNWSVGYIIMTKKRKKIQIQSFLSNVKDAIQETKNLFTSTLQNQKTGFLQPSENDAGNEK